MTRLVRDKRDWRMNGEGAGVDTLILPFGFVEVSWMPKCSCESPGW